MIRKILAINGGVTQNDKHFMAEDQRLRIW